MAIRTVQSIFLTIVGDGTATSFSFPITTSTLPSSVFLWPNSNIPGSETASIDIPTRTLVLTFTVPPANNIEYPLQVDLFYDSGSTGISPTSTPVTVGNFPVDASGNVKVNVMAGGTSGNAAIGVIGSPIPSSAILLGAKDSSGNLQPLKIDSVGGLIMSAVDGGAF